MHVLQSQVVQVEENQHTHVHVNVPIGVHADGRPTEGGYKKSLLIVYELTF